MNYAVQRLAIDNLAWCPVVPDQHTDGFSIMSATGAPMLLRTDAANPTTEKPLPAGMQEIVAAAATFKGKQAVVSRFARGRPIVYLKSAVPSDTAIVTFVENDI